MRGLPPVAVQHRNVETTILISGAKQHRRRRVEEVRIEDYGAVLPVGNMNGPGVNLLQMLFDEIAAAIIGFEVPVQRRHRVVDHESAGNIIEIGVVRGDPEVDVHRCEIGMG